MKGDTWLGLLVQIERLVPCQSSAYQLALCRLIEGEVEASESATATKTLKKINNTLVELRTISNHPLMRSTHPSSVCVSYAQTLCADPVPCFGLPWTSIAL